MLEWQTLARLMAIFAIARAHFPDVPTRTLERNRAADSFKPATQELETPHALAGKNP
jgi:hypothetical protein